MKLRSILFCTLTFGVALTACKSMKQSGVKTADSFPQFSYEGHRGARGLYPENSIIAMKAAIDLPHVTTLEMDCHITKDKRVVVYHDHYLNPKFVTQADGKEIPADKKDMYIYNYTYPELQKFDIGSKFYAEFPDQKKVKTEISLLSTLIDSAESYAAQKRNSPMYYNIETKSKAGADGKFHPGPQEFVDLLLAVVTSKGIAPRTVIQSFDKRTIQYIHKAYPQIKTSYLIDAKNTQSAEEIVQELGFTPFIISPNYNLVTQEFVKDFHKHQMKVIPWTVNDALQIKQLKQFKVDGIISDYPNLFQK